MKGIRNRRSKGFTLMEMLIVVAIIAVLAAIGIPVISTQLEKSRETTDLANIRNAYAEVSIAIMYEDDLNFSVTVPLKQKKDGWQTSGYKETILGLGTVEGEPGEDGSCEVAWSAETERMILTFNGLRYAFPDDIPGFGQTYAKLVSKYLSDDVINKQRFDSKVQTYNGHGIVNISTADGNFSGYILNQARKDKYPESVINMLDNSVSRKAYVAYFDSEYNLIGYMYKQQEGPNAWSPEYAYLRDAYGNLIKRDAPSALDDRTTKQLLADYVWPQQ